MTRRHEKILSISGNISILITGALAEFNGHYRCAYGDGITPVQAHALLCLCRDRGSDRRRRRDRFRLVGTRTSVRSQISLRHLLWVWRVCHRPVRLPPRSQGGCH